MFGWLGIEEVPLMCLKNTFFEIKVKLMSKYRFIDYESLYWSL